MDKIVVRKYRCCMCPQNKEDLTFRLCPSNELTGKPVTACEFTHVFCDDAGRTYMVTEEKDGTFAVKYKEGFGGDRRVKRCKEISASKSVDDAQTKLNMLAAEKGFMAVLSDGSCRYVSEYIMF